VLGSLALANVGCSDVDGEVGTGGSGGTGGNGGTGATGGTPSETQTVYYEFYERSPGGEEPRLEGVRICGTYADTTQSCETSNASGRAAIEFRTNEEFTSTIEKEGYGPFISGLIIGATPYGEGWVPSPTLSFPLEPDSDLEALAAQLETSYPWQGGIVALSVNDSTVSAYTSLEGVTFVPVGSTVDEVGDAFYYDAATEQYSLELEATSAAVPVFSLPLYGEGGFTEVTPGVQEFEIIGAGDCHGPGVGWAGDEPNRIRVPVRDGFLTFGRIECDPL
jgi:hypothetical protein